MTSVRGSLALREPASSLMDDRALIPALIERGDFLRRSPGRFGKSGAYKEWQHFLIHVPESKDQNSLKLIVNFNLIDDVWAPEQQHREAARLIVLARSTKWVGATERLDRCDDAQDSGLGDPVKVEAGKINLDFGPHRLRWTGSSYEVSVDLPDHGIGVELSFVPTALPSPEMNRALAPGVRLSWFVVPRLLASGTVVLPQGTWEVEDALAYHDHNWATFRWGDDFTWEWASILPEDSECPWSIVLMRLTDRKRTVVRAQAVLVWHKARPIKRFRDKDITVHSEGLFRAPEPFMIPPVMKLLNTGRTADVPKRWHLEATSNNDSRQREDARPSCHISLEFIPTELSQVVMPSEVDLEGVTVLNEVTGPVRVRGVIDDKHFDFTGQGVFEFLRPD